jgi:ubiquinone/menaquinone biosynthesis C-methylase UbiE
MSARNWDNYYQRVDNNGVMWFCPADIKRIAAKYNIDQKSAEFIWRRTEHSVRTYELLDVKDNCAILEVGCGGGSFTAGLLLYNAGKKMTMVAVDYSLVAVENARKKIKALGLEGKCNLQVEDATKLTFPPECFDVVIVPSVIEHIPNQEKAVSEFARVCKNGGLVIVSTDNIFGQISVITLATFIAFAGSLLRKVHLLSKDHTPHTSNTPSEFREKIQKSGLEIETFEFTHFSLPFWRDLLRLIRVLPRSIQMSIFKILSQVEESSRKSKLGVMHGMYIVVARKK